MGNICAIFKRQFSPTYETNYIFIWEGFSLATGWADLDVIDHRCGLLGRWCSFAQSRHGSWFSRRSFRQATVWDSQKIPECSLVGGVNFFIAFSRVCCHTGSNGWGIWMGPFIIHSTNDRLNSLSHRNKWII
jgi:hypothetical protein